MRIRPLPEVRRYGSVVFYSFELGVKFMREVARQVSTLAVSHIHVHYIIIIIIIRFCVCVHEYIHVFVCHRTAMCSSLH